jgi:hypothetical protein
MPHEESGIRRGMTSEKDRERALKKKTNENKDTRRV